MWEKMISKSHPRGRDLNHGLGKPRISLSYMGTHVGLLFSRNFTQDRLSAHIRNFYLSLATSFLY